MCKLRKESIINVIWIGDNYYYYTLRSQILYLNSVIDRSQIKVHEKKLTTQQSSSNAGLSSLFNKISKMIQV